MNTFFKRIARSWKKRLPLKKLENIRTFSCEKTICPGRDPTWS